MPTTATPDPPAPRAPRVLVVGAGMSGAACARALRGAGMSVTLLDRGRAPGGRMASREVQGRQVDTGARYLTARDDTFSAVVRDWDARGVAAPWTTTFHTATPDEGVTDVKEGPVRWSSPSGSRALVLDLLSGADVRSGVHVEAVGRADDGRPHADGEAADAVVLAMPDPQAARLVDAAALPDLAALLDGPPWTPQLALVAAWERRGWADDLDGAFVQGSDVLEWVADDGRRRGDGAPVLVAHSTSAFASEHLDEDLSDVAGPAVAPLLAEVRRTLSVEAEPVVVQCQRWGMASPGESHDEPFGLARAGRGWVGVCGDAWGGSPRVEQAFTSGRLLGEELAARLAGR